LGLTNEFINKNATEILKIDTNGTGIVGELEQAKIY